MGRGARRSEIVGAKWGFETGIGRVEGIAGFRVHTDKGTSGRPHETISVELRIWRTDVGGSGNARVRRKRRSFVRGLAGDTKHEKTFHRNRDTYV